MKIESFTIKDWDEVETGVLLEENEEWILIKSLPVDFQVDGCRLLKKEFITDREQAEDAEILSKVFELKKLNFSTPEGFKFGGVLQMLKNIEERYGCFEFQVDIEDELFYGVLGKYDLKSFYIDAIKSDGSIDLEFDTDFHINEVRIISFESDYFQAISLLYNNNKTL